MVGVGYVSFVPGKLGLLTDVGVIEQVTGQPYAAC